MKKTQTNNKQLLKYSLNFWVLNFCLFLFSVSLTLKAFNHDEIKNSCKNNFLSINNASDPTSALIRYLSELYEIEALGKSDINKLHENLKLGKLVNPISEQVSSVNPLVFLQNQTIEELFMLSEIDLNTLKKWCQEQLNFEETVNNYNNQIKDELRRNYTPMLFYPIEIPQKFLGITVPKFVNAPRVIEVMSTPITEMHWYSLLGDTTVWSEKRSLRIWVDKYNVPVPEIVKNNSGQDISLRPNHPAVGFTLLSALSFANKMSVHHNLEQAYDLRDIEIKSVNNYFDPYADGSLETTETVFNVKFNTKANGYRLPTREEQLFLLGIKKLNNNKLTLQQIELLAQDSFLNPIHYEIGGVKNVAELSPRWIGEKPFYDLFGHTFEIEQQTVRTNYLFFLNSANTVIVNFYSSGANIFSDRTTLINDMIKQQSEKLTLNNYHPYRSFRLVRTIRP